ncbi:MAG TPA: NUDIX domain-containing protein [Caulobacteraceae bacterium]|jgi:8-oxo-dGTP pyrophosphatase MutT (NUDIX family)
MQTLDDLAVAFVPTLERLTPLLEMDDVQWPNARLRRRVFIGDLTWPEPLTTSARAVVFKGSKVVVVSQTDGLRHIQPGGGLEPGETIEAAARRELGEETGWTVGPLKLLGFQLLEPLTPKPPGSTRRWGNMVHALFVAEAVAYDRSRRDTTQIETGSRLISIRQALAELADDEALLLRAAIERRAQP